MTRREVVKVTIGIVIPADEELPIYSRIFDSLEEYQEVLGGNLEHVEINSPELAGMFVDEEGLMKRPHEFNIRASLFLMIHNPAFLFHGAHILGPAIIVGPPDSEGNTQDAPDPYIKLLLHTLQYKIEVQTADNAEAWNSNQRTFAELEDAYKYGIDLAYRWTAVERVRVVPA